MARASSPHQRPKTFYHGTSVEAALSIQANGFDPERSGSNAGALLGKGVYCTTTLQKALHYAGRNPAQGIIFELEIDLGRCKKLERGDPMMTTWQNNGYDSAWAPGGANTSGLEENCVKDPGRIRIVRAIAGHTGQLQQIGMTIDANGKVIVVAPATCDVAGCSRMTWNGQMNQQCCRTCKQSGGTQHGPDCNRKHRNQGRHSQAQDVRVNMFFAFLSWIGKSRARIVVSIIVALWVLLFIIRNFMWIVVLGFIFRMVRNHSVAPT